ncbi:MAG: TIGR01777 family oxidoreductase [Bacteroidales bacterium]|nr:TIGR01777 family oxidoreductase [Bacteroidales bacterium]
MDSKTNIAISGATGFIGKNLLYRLNEMGCNVFELGRDLFYTDNDHLTNIISNADIVINLAGAPLNKKWTDDYKRTIIESRLHITRSIVNAINKTQRTKLLISTSAVGIYPTDGCFDESYDSHSKTFLGRLCNSWEEEVKRVRIDVRVVITRFGIVLAPKGGAYEKMVLPFQNGISVTIADKNNFISWIDIEDLINGIIFIIENKNISGVVNFTAPDIITQKKFADVLSLHNKTLIRMNIPSFVLKLLLGEYSQLLTQSVCVKPAVLTSLSFNYKSPNFENFVERVEKQK